MGHNLRAGPDSRRPKVSSVVRRLLFASVLTALALFAPAAVGQGTPSATLTLSGLPAETDANGTLAALPFEVTLSLDSVVCIGTGPFTFPVALSANATDGASVEVTPVSLEFVVSPGQSLVSSYEGTMGATLLVGSPAPLTANVTVSAVLAGASGCTAPMGTPTASAGGATAVTFTASSGSQGEATEELPAPGAVAVVAAFALALVTLRRRR